MTTPYHALGPSAKWPVKQIAYRADPECWVSYSGKPKSFKRAMDARRTAALHRAAAAYGALPRAGRDALRQAKSIETINQLLVDFEL